MKKLIFGFTILTSFSLASQNYAIETYLDSFRISGTTTRSLLARTSTGKLFQIPYEYNNPNPQRLKVIVTDSALNVEHLGAFDFPNVNWPWPERFFGIGANRAVAVSDFNMAGSIFTTIDTLGQATWAFYSGELNSACPTADGGYLAFGSDSNKVIRFDSMSTILWQYRYVPPVGYAFRLNDAIEFASTGEVTLTGRLNNLTTFDSIFTAVIRIDANGNFMWAKRYYTAVGNALLTSYELHQDFYTGDLYMCNVNVNETVVLGLDYSGNYKWFRSYSRNGCTAGTIPNYFFDGYGGMIYLETIYACNMSGPLTVMCIDKANGNLVWTKFANHGLTSFSHDQYGPDLRYGSGWVNVGKVNDAISVQCSDNVATSNDISQVLAAPYSINVNFTSVSVTTTLNVFSYINQGTFPNTIGQGSICENLTAVPLKEESGVVTQMINGVLHVDQTAEANGHFVECVVCDIHGRTVSKSVLGGDVADIPMNCSSGIYSVVLTKESGERLTRKLLFNN